MDKKEIELMTGKNNESGSLLNPNFRQWRIYIGRISKHMDILIVRYFLVASFNFLINPSVFE